MVGLGDTGRMFEERAIAVARARHDPSGLQGAIIHKGRERDGVFIDESSINAYEFTCDRTKAKAVHDGEKLAELIGDLSRLPEHRYKAAAGYFVTELEPTAEQRGAIQSVARAHGVILHCLSASALRNSLVNVEDYIARRLAAPFGSTSFRAGVTSEPDESPRGYVEATFRAASTGAIASLDDIHDALLEGERMLLLGDYGIGKSAALKELFKRLRRTYFKKPFDRPFPVHINLRDCTGLRSAREVFQRHAEEIGFSGERGLIGAWRAGHVLLLLDGFDELIPQRWVGTPRDVKQVRWQALSAVRNLIEESPAPTGILVAGRTQYFADRGELDSALGIRSPNRYDLQDFDEMQVRAYLGDSLSLPAWIPPRPLLLELVAVGARSDSLLAGAEESRGEAWSSIIDSICRREAQRVVSIPSETFVRLLGRISIEARSSSSGLGPVTLDDMRRVFYEVCGYEAEGEALQALLRLPGLRPDASPGSAEARSFIDEYITDAAYGIELAEYIGSPHSAHPLAAKAQWSSAARPLAAEVASVRFSSHGYLPEHSLGAIHARLNAQHYDAVLFDVCAVAAAVGAAPRANSIKPFVVDVMVPSLAIVGPSPVLEQITFRGCVFDVLDVSDIDDVSNVPVFDQCLIDTIEGWSEVPAGASPHFLGGTEIENFDAHSTTTSSIMALELGVRQRIALSILKKVYMQAGAARRASALSRGLPLDSRHLVEAVVSDLCGAGLLVRSSGKGEDLVSPARDQRATASEILRAPSLIRSYILD